MFKNSKNIILGLLITSGLYFQACKKASDLKPSTEMSEGLSSSQGINIQTPYGVIRYENARLSMSEITYDKIMEMMTEEEISSLLANTNFVSINNKLKNNNNLVSEKFKDMFENEKLAYILSSQGVIQIGDWIIKIDVDNEKVFVLHKDNQSQIDDLLSGNTNNPNIILYSIYDEVLTLLREGIFHSERGIFCGDIRAQFKIDKDVYSNNGGNEIVCKVVYRPLGIRFVLASTVNYRNGWFPVRGDLLMKFQYRYQVRCNKDGSGGEVFGDSYYICADPNYNYFCVKTNATHFEIKHYKNKFALKKYDLRSIFGVSDEGYYVISNRTHRIISNY